MSLSTAPSSETINREAAKWIARLQRGLYPEEGAELRAWLKTPAHREAILETARLLHGADVNSVLAALIPTKREPEKPKPRPLSFTMPLTFAVLSTVAFGGILLLGHAPKSSGNVATHRVARAEDTEIYSTAIGETKEVKLPDGTTLTLNTATRVGVTYSTDSREVYLSQGEASFDVAYTPARPFIVDAGRRRFQVAGTKFNLRMLPSNTVELTVAEGAVKVLDAPPVLPSTPARRRDPITYGEAVVHAFEEAVVEPGFQSVTHIDANEVESRLAWQRGLIVFEDKALEDALAEVERYTQTRFVVADDKLRHVRVSGQFPIRNVNSVRQALHRGFLVKSRKDETGRVVLTALPTS
jgi:transmembrane sensor